MEREADISDCGRYRYSLFRRWDPAGGIQHVIMLNPSIADAERDDPTIRRCMDFVRRDGFGGLRVLNLFAYRATVPADMKAAADPIGPGNDAVLAEAFALAAASMIPAVVAWGGDGGHLGRAAAVCAMARRAGAGLVCLGTTKAGHPRHPLYVSRSQPFVDYGLK